MPPSAGDRRKSSGRRKVDEEREKMVKEALELGRANQSWQADHQKECLETRIEIRDAQAATDKKVENLLAMQRQQTVTLNEVGEVLPWLKQTYENKKSRERAWTAAGNFVLNMMRKNWDSVSGKLIFVVIAMYLSWRGVPWTDLVKMLAP